MGKNQDFFDDLEQENATSEVVSGRGFKKFHDKEVPFGGADVDSVFMVRVLSRSPKHAVSYRVANVAVKFKNAGASNVDVPYPFDEDAIPSLPTTYQGMKITDFSSKMKVRIPVVYLGKYVFDTKKKEYRVVNDPSTPEDPEVRFLDCGSSIDKQFRDEGLCEVEEGKYDPRDLPGEVPDYVVGVKVVKGNTTGMKNYRLVPVKRLPDWDIPERCNLREFCEAVGYDPDDLKSDMADIREAMVEWHRDVAYVSEQLTIGKNTPDNDDDFESGEPKAPRGRKQPSSRPVDDIEEDDADETPKRRGRGAPVAEKPKGRHDDDFLDEEEEEAPKTRAKRQDSKEEEAPARRRRRVEDEEEEEEEEAPRPTRRRRS